MSSLSSRRPGLVAAACRPWGTSKRTEDRRGFEAMGPGSTALATGGRRGWKAAAGLPLLRVLLLDLESGLWSCSVPASTASRFWRSVFFFLGDFWPEPCVRVCVRISLNFHVQRTKIVRSIFYFSFMAQSLILLNINRDAHWGLCAHIS